MSSSRPGTAPLVALAGLAALLLAVDAGAVHDAAAIGGAASGLRRAVLVYVRVPAVALAACALVWTPGLLAVRAWRPVEDPDGWALYGFGVGIVLCSSLVALLAATGVRAAGSGFVALLFGMTLAAGIAAGARERGAAGAAAGRDRTDPPRRAGAPDPRVWATYLVPAVVLVAALAPKFLRESFNGDGAHAFEAARLLLAEPVPFWGGAAGNIAHFPGLTSMLFAYPASAFIRIFGEVEAAVRLPFVLYLVAMYAGIVALAVPRRERGAPRSGRPLPLVDRGLVWLALAAYALVVAYSTTYNPYHADLALPATQDTLFIASFLGFAFAFARGEPWGIGLFLPLLALSLPSWPLLVAAWLGAVALLWRPVPARMLRVSLAGTALLVVALAAAPTVLGTLGLASPGGEYGGETLLDRLSYLRLTEWRRVLYVAVPAGLLPVLYLALWQRQDPVARALAAVAVLYFGFFYVQAFTALHHYLPPAVLALAAFWRDRDEGRARNARRAAAAVAGVAALALAFPARPAAHVLAREVGLRIEDRRAGYETFDPRFFRPVPPLYTALFVLPRQARAERAYAVSPLALTYYARHGERSSPVTYVLQRTGDPAPAGREPLAVEAGVAIYVVDESRWREDRAHDPPATLAPALAVPPRILYRDPSDPAVIDVRSVLRRLGIR